MNNVVDDPDYAQTFAQLKKRLHNLKEQVGDTDEQFPELLEALKKAG